jgi:diguanylate cyclase (GGDEF)-like protein
MDPTGHRKKQTRHRVFVRHDDVGIDRGVYSRGVSARHNGSMMNRDLVIARLETEVRALKERVRELEACAERDPLTGTLNRRGFERELERIIADLDRYGTRAALIYLDLDDFKSINDRNGHAAGDAVLRQVATTLCRNLRASDSVARLGGDEFAVLLHNMTERGAIARAAALKGAIAATVPVSTGVAMFLPGEKAAVALARADAVMYMLKRTRRATSRA